MSAEVVCPSPARVEMTGSPWTVEGGKLQREFMSLAAPGESDRWHQLQALQRGHLPLEPLIVQLVNGAVSPQADLLAALWGQIDRAGVERLLASAAGADPRPWLEAARQELPRLALQPRVIAAWLDPLLVHQTQVDPSQQLCWLEVLAHFQDPRVAQRLRRRVLELSRQGSTAPARPDGRVAALPLLPLLGRQRQRQDAPLLLQCSLDPGPLPWRRAALEGVALGLSAWPLPLLIPALERLAEDLSPALAAQAVDLLARVPGGQRSLRQLDGRRMEPSVAARLQRRLLCTPLVLVVHGRQGGEIPLVFTDLAQQLAQRRRAPVLLQALTAEAPMADANFWHQAQRAGGLTMVPLLLLPGEHVRRDLPALALAWRSAAKAALGESAASRLSLRRHPFLGSWPTWHALLVEKLEHAAAGRPWIWLHHPLQGRLAQRYLQHLARVLGRVGLAAPEPGQPLELPEGVGATGLVVPLGLAPSRMAESLNMGGLAPCTWEVLPPLLDLPGVRTFLLDRLEALA